MVETEKKEQTWLFEEYYKPQEMFDALAAPFEVWSRAPGAQVYHPGTDKEHIYFDRGAKVLALAHLDSVQPYNGYRYNRTSYTLECSTVDDRIGLWTIMYVLPRMGINVDVLLTTGEETGKSTAQFFKPPKSKSWNWMVELDRGIMAHGKPDWVVYDYYGNKEWRDALGKFMLVNRGANSDINYAQHLGICGVNAQTGMDRYHSMSAFVDLYTWEDGLLAFSDFFLEYENTKFPFDKKKHGTLWPTEKKYTQGSWSTQHCQGCGAKWPRSYPSTIGKERFHLCEKCVTAVLDTIEDTFGKGAIAAMIKEYAWRQANLDYLEDLVEEAESKKKKENDRGTNDTPDEDYESYLPYRGYGQNTPG